MITFDCLDSTSRWVRKHAEELPADALTAVFAYEQTEGYGRRGTPWVSMRGNLHLTLFFCIAYEKEGDIPLYTQLLARTCVEVVSREGILLQIKKPNDLFYQGRKCGGILTESFPCQGKIGISIGLGLNVNADLPPLDQPTTSLKEISGKCHDLLTLAQALISAFDQARS